MAVNNKENINMKWLYPAVLVAIILISGAVALKTLVSSRGRKFSDVRNIDTNFSGVFRRMSLLNRYAKEQFSKIKKVADPMNLTVFANVRLSNVLEANPEADNWDFYNEIIDSKKVDFVICNLNMAVVCAIILTVADYDEEDGKFVESALKDAGVKVFKYRMVNESQVEADFKSLTNLNAVI